jgi:SAM-dependent methyltransferase
MVENTAGSQFMTDNCCPVCSGTDVSRFVNRSDVPVHQNLLLSSPESARSISRGNLDLFVCANCGFVFNRAFDPSRLQYGQDYDNNQGCSSSFQKHIDSLVSILIEEGDVRGKRVVEVGCGQGGFLQRIVEEGDNLGFGFDPSYIGPKEASRGRMKFENRYYDESCTDVQADVVICRHVIEHVPDPLNLLRSVRTAIGDNDNAKVYFETPCVDWILSNTVIWDFFYEHCSLFTSSSLSTVFQKAGFRVDAVRHVFGGQYLWLEASPCESEVVADGEQTFNLAHSYAQHERSTMENWHDRIVDLSMSGKVALWGAGAKGATFANLIDPEGNLIDCVVDLNPNKQGKYIAGSGHAIVDPQQLRSRGVSHAILMNPNYREENEAILDRAGISVKLIE